MIRKLFNIKQKTSKISLIFLLTFSIAVSVISLSQIEATSQSLGHQEDFSVSQIREDGSLRSVEKYKDYDKAKERMNVLNTATNPHVVTVEVLTGKSNLYGDFDGNGSIKLSEISLARRAYLTKDTKTISNDQYYKAGMPQNHQIKLKDISQMRNYYLNKTTASQSTYTKIIAQPSGGFAQSFPYRKSTVGSVLNGKTTLDLFANKNLTTNIGYLPAHYQMQVHDVVKQGNSFVAEVEISGQRGYVDINKIDLIPAAYYTNSDGVGNKYITLGGFDDYYATQQNQYSIKVQPEHYEVKKGDKYNEITFYQYKTQPDPKPYAHTFGIAPDWMSQGVYYSSDDIHYYTDFTKTKAVMDGNKVGEYYSYFQWLPVNTVSLHNSEALKNYLTTVKKTDSAYFKTTSDFITNGEKYGMNSLLIFAQANLESAYGTSKFATDRNNIFGWGAVDSNPENAHKFESLSASIEKHMSVNLADYMNPSHWKHFGFSFGNMSSGVSYKYASDPLYGLKIASIAFSIDKANGYKDYNNYQFTKLPDQVIHKFSSSPTSVGNIYNTTRKFNNTIITNLGTTGNSIKTNRTTPLDSDTKLIDLSKDFAYISNSGTTTYKNYGPSANSVLKEQTVTDSNINEDQSVTESVKPTHQVVNHSNLNLRSEPNTESSVLTLIPKSSFVFATGIVQGQWIQISYEGLIGFVHTDYLIGL